MTITYVLNNRNEPLMPTFNTSKVTYLLNNNKAKVVSTKPFTIKMMVDTGKNNTPMTLGVDTGSAKVGAAVMNETTKEIIYMSEVEIRNDITEKMTQRSKYRRNRRNRKTRYRPARWLNRRNSIRKDRFSPTMTSKINSHMKEINFVESILPIGSIILETATFDAHLLKNPNVSGVGYQQGSNFGFANTKAYVLNRDGYICQSCKGKKKDRKLEVHHIIFRSNNGSDDESNLITLCKTCHDDVHKNNILLKKTGKKKSSLNHATQMNSIRIQLLKRISSVIETFGYITKENRHLLGLEKEHYYDAVAISSQGQQVIIKSKVLIKKCISDGDYQLCKGIRSEQKIPVGKIFGYRKFDKVRYKNRYYFIKGRMSKGYSILMDLSFNQVKLKPIPKFNLMERIESRKSWIQSSIKARHSSATLKK